MANYIMLQSTNDPQSIVKAFQRAVDTVLKPRYVKRVIETGREYRDSQDVCADARGYVIGQASVILGDAAQKDNGGLFIRVYTAERLGNPRRFVPAFTAANLQLSLKGVSERASSHYDYNNMWFQVCLLVPLRILRDHPKGVVTIR